MDKKRVAPILLALLTVLCSPARGRTECGPEKKFPRFEAKDVTDVSRTVKATELFSGKTTILSFFATWCRPCKEEIPELRALAARYTDRGFQAVLVSLDRDRNDALAFLKSAGSGSLLALWDGERKIKDLYRVSQLPTNVRIDPDGCVAASWSGYLPEKLHELENHLKTLPKVVR